MKQNRFVLLSTSSYWKHFTEKSCENQTLTQLLTTRSLSLRSAFFPTMLKSIGSAVPIRMAFLWLFSLRDNRWKFRFWIRLVLVKQTAILQSRKSAVFISLLKFPCNQIRPCGKGGTRMFVLNGGKIEFFWLDSTHRDRGYYLEGWKITWFHGAYGSQTSKEALFTRKSNTFHKK